MSVHLAPAEPLTASDVHGEGGAHAVGGYF
jgi:hypothetical protein